MWRVPSYSPQASVSVLLALRDQRSIPGAGQGVHRTREVRALDLGSGPALRRILRTSGRRAAASPVGVAGDDSRVIVDRPPRWWRNRTPSNNGRYSGDGWLSPDLVEYVVVPGPLPEHDLELLRREHRLLVLKNVLDRDPRTRRVDPRIHAVSLEQLGSDEVHEEQIRLLPVFLGEGLQLRRQLDPRLADLLRDDDPKDAGIVRANDRGVSLSEHAVSHLPEIPRGPAFGVRDDDRLVDEDRDAERVEVSRADVEVTVDVLLHDRRRVIVATEELTRIRDPPVGLADLDDMAFLLQMLLDVGKPVAELRRRQERDSLRQHRLRRVDESHRGQRGAGQIVEEDAVVPEVGHRGVAQVTMRSTGISATSHAPNDGSAETRHVTPAFASISCASSTAFVRKPTGNCRPTVFAFRPRITSRSRFVSPMDLDRHADARGKRCPFAS